MAINQPPLDLAAVARSYHRGEFHEVRATISALKVDAAVGRLDRRAQALLLELAEYGLFYTSFYERLVRQLQEGDEHVDG